MNLSIPLSYKKNMTVNYIDITEEALLSPIDEIKPNSAIVPGVFPAIMFKTCKKTLLKPIQMLFLCFLECSTYPQTLKE